MAVGYFFDSYAIIELTNGNPRYARFSDEVITLTIFNLVEITYSAFLQMGEEKAQETYRKFLECVQNIDEEIVFEALQLKQKYKKRDLSYTDCLGYAFAKQRNLRFLTGDRQFEDIDNVEYVK